MVLMVGLTALDGALTLRGLVPVLQPAEGSDFNGIALALIGAFSPYSFCKLWLGDGKASCNIDPGTQVILPGISGERHG
jgi:hypothetical protein